MKPLPSRKIFPYRGSITLFCIQSLQITYSILREPTFNAITYIRTDKKNISDKTVEISLISSYGGGVEGRRGDLSRVNPYLVEHKSSEFYLFVKWNNIRLALFVNS